jgi:5-hydroxyisourate hydrolase-like protein (transthyretin family)
MAWVALIVAAVGWLDTAAQQPPRDTPARSQADPPAPAARISGRVVDAVTGRPMKMVTVRLISEAGGRADQTDEAGVFDFTGLSAGRYDVRVQKAGYVSLAYGQRRPLLPGTPLQVDAGQHIKGIEFRMPRGGVVSGTVSDELGEPMPGITVRLLRYQYRQGVRTLAEAGTGRTDDRGIYRIWGLDPGEYFVSAVAPNFNGRGSIAAPAGRGGRGVPAGRGLPAGASSPPSDDVEVGYAPTYYPGVPSAFEATPVTLGLGAELLDISFNVLLVRTAAVSGRVTNTDGTPVTAGNVNLAIEGQAGRGGPGVNLGGRIRWDGVFSIPNVPPGRYVIRARGTDDTFPQYGVSPITVVGQDLSDVVVVVSPGATLTGMLTFQGNQAPPDFTQVRITAQPTEPTFGATVNTRVEKDGRFTLVGIPLGPIWIRAQAPRGWALKSVVVDGHETIDTPLDMRTGQRLSGASLIFTDRQTELNGTLTDVQGRPLTEYTVLAFPIDSTLWRPQARQIMTARPDQNGRFQIRGLPPGDYYLAATDPQQQGEWFVPTFLEQQIADASRLTLAEGATRTQDLRLNR